MGETKGIQTGPNKEFVDRLVGRDKISEICINGTETMGLIDTGSMISTITEDFILSLNPVPQLYTIEDLGLKVNVANGQTLENSGCVVVDVSVPCSGEARVLAPCLVVPMRVYNKEVPIIVGTNIINRVYQCTVEGTADIPTEWATAFQAIRNDQVGVVRTTTSVVLQPNETRTISGLAQKSRDSASALTEPLEDGLTSKVSVCPRVVRTNRPGTTARIPVRVCNLSAKVVTIPAHSSVCNLTELKVLKRDPMKEMTEMFSAERHQHTVSKNTCKLDIDLDGTVLTEKQKEEVQNFLSKWTRIFSQRPTDLGRMNLVEHEIHLEDERPFKEPYRKIPPALVEEVREHLTEMLEIGAMREFTSHFSSNVVIVRKKDGDDTFLYRLQKTESANHQGRLSHTTH